MEEVNYYGVSLVTRKLRKHRYSFKQTQQNTISDEMLADLIEDSIPAPDVKKKKAKKDERKEKFQKSKKVKKPKFSIFEEVVQEETLEEKVAKLVNGDGYYDPLLPLDYGQEGIYKTKVNRKMLYTVAFLIGIAIISIASLVFVFTKLF